jgi:sensor histidine kinase regulating citrate/malate metabolism
MIMKNYVADELSNKVYHLTKALNQAQNIIKVLEEENEKLKDVLANLASINNQDYVNACEIRSESTDMLQAIC